jgi:hypothetical protein
MVLLAKRLIECHIVELLVGELEAKLCATVVISKAILKS